MSDGQGVGVYRAINNVMSELAKQGIAKDGRNQQQNYTFRGIDAVYNTLCTILAENGLCILPRYIDRTCEERQSKNGGALFYSTVHGEFDIVCSEDGSRHTVSTFGEAMDSADKSTNKAMSCAFKYAAFQAFCIPTEGDNDADAITHEVAPRQQSANVHRPAPATQTDEEKKYAVAYNAALKILNGLTEPQGADAAAKLRTYNVEKLAELSLADIRSFGRWLEAEYTPTTAGK